MEIAIMVILAYTLGLYFGNKMAKGKEIEVPIIKEVKQVVEHYKQKDIRKEQETLNTIINNIENYDGTSAGQKVVK